MEHELPFTNACVAARGILEALGRKTTVECKRGNSALLESEFRWENRPLVRLIFNPLPDHPQFVVAELPDGGRKTATDFRQWLDQIFEVAFVDAIDRELRRLIHLRGSTKAPRSDDLRVVFQKIRPDIMHV